MILKKAHNKVYKHFNITHEPQNKLIATTQDKTKYVVIISTLKQALNHGLILSKVHRVIEFNQSNWLKSYIDKKYWIKSQSKKWVWKELF